MDQWVKGPKDIIYFAIDKPIALKRFRYDDIDLLMREVSVLKAIDHPNIIKFSEFQHFRHDDMVGYTMKRYQFDLDGYTKYKPTRPIEEDIAIIDQLLAALKFLHKHNIWHRDVKQQNVLVDIVDQQPQIVLCDFGSCRTDCREGHEYTGGLQTLPWRAPEVAFELPAYGNKIDAFSTGMLIAGLISNRLIIYELPDHALSFKRLLSKQLISLLGNFDGASWLGVQGSVAFEEYRAEANERGPGDWWVFYFDRYAPRATTALIDLIRSLTIPNPAYRKSILEVAGHVADVGSFTIQESCPAQVDDPIFNNTLVVANDILKENHTFMPLRDILWRYRQRAEWDEFEIPFVAGALYFMINNFTAAEDIVSVYSVARQIRPFIGAFTKYCQKDTFQPLIEKIIVIFAALDYNIVVNNQLRTLLDQHHSVQTYQLSSREGRKTIETNVAGLCRYVSFYPAQSLELTTLVQVAIVLTAKYFKVKHADDYDKSAYEQLIAILKTEPLMIKASSYYERAKPSIEMLLRH